MGGEREEGEERRRERGERERGEGERDTRREKEEIKRVFTSAIVYTVSIIFHTGQPFKRK